MNIDKITLSEGESSDPKDWPTPLDEKLQHFVDYWRSLKPKDGGIPKHSDVQPRPMADYLSGIMIIERIIDDGRTRYRYRLTGNDSYEVSGTSLKGRYLDEVIDEEGMESSEIIFERVLESGEPNYLLHRNHIRDRDFIYYERIVAPLLDKNGEANLIIGLWRWEWV